jgi:hypothetical protein
LNVPWAGILAADGTSPAQQIPNAQNEKASPMAIDPAAPTLTVAQYFANQQLLDLLGLSVNIADTAANVAANANALEPLALAGQISSISVVDTAADVAANLDALQVLAAAGELASITLTDPATPTLVITENQLSSDAQALQMISGPYGLAVTNVLAADAQNVGGQPNVVSVAVSDTGANIAASLTSLFQYAFATNIDTGAPLYPPLSITPTSVIPLSAQQYFSLQL